MSINNMIIKFVTLQCKSFHLFLIHPRLYMKALLAKKEKKNTFCSLLNIFGAKLEIRVGSQIWLFLLFVV